MSNAAKPFAFSQLVPGFDFLKSLTGGGAGGAVPGLPGLSNWVAPTLSVEELDKRINELKTVQYWLEQNVHALKATIQALEVQKMTLSTLQGMNVRMEDLANAFTRTTASAAAAMRDAATAAAAPTAAPEAKPAAAQAPAQQPAPAEEEEEEEEAVDAQTPDAPSRARGGKKADAAPAQGVVDTLQWWNSLTQQFQQIASNALQDAAQLRLPTVPAGAKGDAPASAAQARTAAGKKALSTRKPAAKAALKKASASSRSPRAAAKPTAARKSGSR